MDVMAAALTDRSPTSNSLKNSLIHFSLTGSQHLRHLLANDLSAVKSGRLKSSNACTKAVNKLMQSFLFFPPSPPHIVACASQTLSAEWMAR